MRTCNYHLLLARRLHISEEVFYLTPLGVFAHRIDHYVWYYSVVLVYCGDIYCVVCVYEPCPRTYAVFILSLSLVLMMDTKFLPSAPRSSFLPSASLICSSAKSKSTTLISSPSLARLNSSREMILSSQYSRKSPASFLFGPYEPVRKSLVAQALASVLLEFLGDGQQIRNCDVLLVEFRLTQVLSRNFDQRVGGGVVTCLLERFDQMIDDESAVH